MEFTSLPFCDCCARDGLATNSNNPITSMTLLMISPSLESLRAEAARRPSSDGPVRVSTLVVRFQPVTDFAAQFFEQLRVLLPPGGRDGRAIFPQALDGVDAIAIVLAQ